MDYRSFNGSIPNLLNEIYLEKKKRNKNFSMRAFARDIGLPPGRLSEVLTGKRNFTLKMAQKFSEAYQLSTDDKKALYKLVNSQTKLRTKKLVERHFIPPQDFEKICHWKYYALVCLIQNTPGGAVVSTLAKQMGLSESEIQTMLNVFEKISLVTQTDGLYHAPNMSTTTTQDVLDESIRRFQKEMLAYHSQQISQLPIEVREAQTMIFPLPLSKVSAAKLAIRKFYNDFELKFGTANTTDIYSLSMLLTPVTSVKEK